MGPRVPLQPVNGQRAADAADDGEAGPEDAPEAGAGASKRESGGEPAGACEGCQAGGCTTKAGLKAWLLKGS